MSTPDDGAAREGQPAYGQAPWGPPQYGPEQYGPGQYGPPPHDQAPYGQYAPPPYGQPGYGYPYARPTNTLAILSLVLAFVFAPAGLVTGIIARRQIRRTHEDGAGLALAGIIVGGIATAFFVLLIVVWLIAVISLTNDGFAP
ncbi:DUF4190 domain-containing protein [Blastococcus sp. TF02-09]|uniref:DUF4190 domain-containing protein n=1 Tax=Blastococcus sp. TF02-09 TaxID=2250576 RepID=UPI000DE9E49A|nr:DUF4190 domain-containing protein [Blastococcus sp. TF02-9]RBY76943.1 DUF4190 domain-containing protein [Blastococcus sp. TF02-9]